MQLIRAVLSGWKIAGANNRILILYYLANILFAIIAAVPLYLVLTADYNFRLAGGKLAGQFDLDFFLEFIFRNNDFLTGAALATAGIAVLYALLNTFFAGGAIAAFVAERKRYDAALFWGNCGYYFSAFFRLTLLALLFYGTIVFFVFPGILSLAASLFKVITPGMDSLAKTAAGAISVFMLAATLVIFDYAKVSLVVTGERNIFAAFCKSIKAFSKNVLLSFSLIIAFSFLNLFIYLFYSFISDFLQAPTIIALISIIVLQQVFIFTKLKLRLTYFASIVVLHPHLFFISPHRLYDKLTPNSGKQEAVETQ